MPARLVGTQSIGENVALVTAAAQATMPVSVLCGYSKGRRAHENTRPLHPVVFTWRPAGDATIMKQGAERCTVLLIAGMQGNACREKVSAALEAVRGVQSVDVTLYRAQATIIHDSSCGASDLFRATLNSGYNASLPEESTRTPPPRLGTIGDGRRRAAVPGRTA